MNIKFQSRVLAALLVLASCSVSIQPTFAASTAITAPVSGSLNATTVDNKALWNQVSELVKSGDIQKAMAIINQAIKTDPNNSTAYMIKAVVMCNAKQAPGLVIEQLNIALSIEPDYSDALYLRGLMYEDLGDLKHAGADFDACIALNVHDMDAIAESIQVKYAQKDWAGMLEVLKVEFANNEVDGMAYFARALAEYQLGQTSAAIADFKQAQSMFTAANDSKDAQTVANILQQIQGA